MVGFLSNIWDFIWMFFTIFVFFAWLMVLFSIISDLFREYPPHWGPVVVPVGAGALEWR